MEEVREKARRYLYRYIGNLVTAGRPVFDRKEKVWRVPILAKTDKGIFPVGELELDERGAILAAPKREEIVAIVKRQREHTLTLVREPPEEVEKRGLTPVKI